MKSFLKSSSVTIFTFLGWYGMVAILLAYGLLSFNFLHPHDFSYQLLSGSGAIGLIFEASHQNDRPVVVLNSIFALIAIISLIRILYGLA